MGRHSNPLISNHNLTATILKSVERREDGIGWRLGELGRRGKEGRASRMKRNRVRKDNFYWRKSIKISIVDVLGRQGKYQTKSANSQSCCSWFSPRPECPPCLYPVLNSPPPWQAPEKKIRDMGPLKSHFTFHKYICLLSQLFTQRVNNFLHEDETQLSPTSVTWHSSWKLLAAY